MSFILYHIGIHFKVQYQLSAMSNHNFRQPPFNSIDFSPPYKYNPQEH